MGASIRTSRRVHKMQRAWLSYSKQQRQWQSLHSRPVAQQQYNQHKNHCRQVSSSADGITSSHRQDMAGTNN